MRTIKDLKIGESGVVVKLYCEGAIKRRIMDMGITKGVKITVRKVAPLGDPLELNLRQRLERSIYLSLDLCGGIKEKYIQGKKII